MKNFAIILSAGNSTRFRNGNSIPKQYANLSNDNENNCLSKTKDNHCDTVLALSLRQFFIHEKIDGIFVVIQKKDEKISKLIIDSVVSTFEKSDDQNNKFIKTVYGGEQRYISVINAIKRVNEFLEKNNFHDANILVHDAARPFIDDNIISRVLYALNEHEIVDLALYNTDTLRLHSDACETLDRNKIYAVQTPQGFRFSKIKECCNNFNYEDAFPHDINDEVGICLKYFEGKGDLKFKTVEGNKINFKITHNSDLEYAKFLFNLKYKKG